MTVTLRSTTSFECCACKTLCTVGYDINTDLNYHCPCGEYFKRECRIEEKGCHIRARHLSEVVECDHCGGGIHRGRGVEHNNYADLNFCCSDCARDYEE
jgi:hypothetical protein